MKKIYKVTEIIQKNKLIQQDKRNMKLYKKFMKRKKKL